MSDQDKPECGHMKLCGEKVDDPRARPGSSPLDRSKNLLRKIKMVPLRVGAWPSQKIAAKIKTPGRVLADDAHRFSAEQPFH